MLCHYFADGLDVGQVGGAGYVDDLSLLGQDVDGLTLSDVGGVTDFAIADKVSGFL